MNIKAIIKTTVATCIESECSLLLAKSREMINSRQVAAQLFSVTVDTLFPIVPVTAEYTVAVKDDFGAWTAAKQRWNDALWLISMSLLSEFKALNSHNIGGAIYNWAQDAENCATQLTEEQADNAGEKCIIALQAAEWIEQTPQQYVEDIGGQPRKVMKFPCTEKFDRAYQLALDTLKERAHMVCQPLRHKPKPWVDNFTGVAEDAKLKLVKGYPHAYISEDVLDAANIAMSTAYEVHPDISELAALVVDNDAIFKGILGYNSPIKADGTLAWTPAKCEERSRKWQGHLQQWREIAKLELNTPYYFPVTFDFRGRMYYRGGSISPQGSDACKAAFVFHRSLPLGAHGFKALCVGLASALGVKESVNGRVLYVQQHLQTLIDLSANFIDFASHELTQGAEYVQAWLLTREIKRALDHKAKTGTVATFKSNVPVHQDGTCSGLQHISIITKDYATAQSVNMTPATHDDKPQDVYGLVAEGGNESGLFPEKLERDHTKHAVMVGGYGGGEATIRRGISDALQNPDERAYDAVMAGMEKKAPALKKYTNALQMRAQAAIDAGAVQFEWRTLDGFHIVSQYTLSKGNSVRGKLYSAHVQRHDRTLDARKMVTSLSPHTIHGQDSCHLRMSIVASRMDVATVHDSYGTHAANFFQFNDVLRKNLFALYNEHDMLADLCGRNNMRPVAFIPNGHELEMILDAKNCFG